MSNEHPDFNEVLRIAYEDMKSKGDDGPIIPNVGKKVESFMKESLPEVEHELIEQAVGRAAEFFMRVDFGASTQEGREEAFRRMEKILDAAPFSVLDIKAANIFFLTWHTTVIEPIIKAHGTAVRSSKARNSAIQKHAKSPKAKAKLFVRERWEWWQKNLGAYKSKAAFARDMLDKEDDLKSQDTIERWCVEWEREGKQ